jgi:hypothetical protein
MKYLDSVGLTYLWGKITSIFATKEELAEASSSSSTQYVICTLSDYNAMASHDSDTYYIIISESNA